MKKEREEETDSATTDREKEKDNEEIWLKRTNRTDKWVTSRLEVQTARESILEKYSRGHARCCGDKIATEVPASPATTKNSKPPPKLKQRDSRLHTSGTQKTRQIQYAVEALPPLGTCMYYTLVNIPVPLQLSFKPQHTYIHSVTDSQVPTTTTTTTPEFNSPQSPLPLTHSSPPQNIHHN